MNSNSLLYITLDFRLNRWTAFIANYLMRKKRLYGWSIGCLFIGFAAFLLVSSPKALALTDSTTNQSVVASQSSTDPSTETDSTTTTTVVNNSVTSTAQSGNATVSDNTTGGDATSGSATTTATVVTTVGTVTGSTSSPWQTTTQNVTGDQNSDVSVDPTSPSSSQGGSSSAPNTTTTTTVQTTNAVNNNVTLDANSGDAAVTNNGAGGNATSGSATADANLVNVIDTAVSDSQSFVSVINIFGNLNGDIVLPENLTDNVLANNSTPASQNLSSQVTNNITVNNQVTLLAQSGQASVINNGTAGNATSGNAATNLLLYNLVNNQVSGGNLLLIFVNVLGTWTGVLLNEPSGTDSAVIGSAGSQDNSIPSTLVDTNTETLNNNVYLDANSGNALVANNTTGGNATTGNASSSANVINVVNSSINLSGWFGILLINVFGSWNGSIVIASPGGNGNTNSSPSAGQPSAELTVQPTVNKSPFEALIYRLHHSSLFMTGTTSSSIPQSPSITLTSATLVSHVPTIAGALPGGSTSSHLKNLVHNSSIKLQIVTGLVLAAAIALIIGERVMIRQQIK